MNPEEAVSALKTSTEHLKDVPAQALAELERAARDAGGVARAAAAQAHHSVTVRVVTRGGGVRVTVLGPHAARYRALVQRELDARMPGVKAEIRAKVTRKAR